MCTIKFLERPESGDRSFSEADRGMLNMIECLKRTEMLIKEDEQITAD